MSTESKEAGTATAFRRPSADASLIELGGRAERIIEIRDGAVVGG